MISISAGLQAELEKESQTEKPVLLLRMSFTTGFRRFAVWTHDVVLGPATYFAMPPIDEMEVPQWNQGSQQAEQSIRFMVQEDPSLLADLQQNCRGRWADGFLVSLVGGAPIDGDSIYLWRRRMIPGQTFGDAKTDWAELILESRFHRHRNRSPRTYSNSEQLKRDPTDLAFRDSGFEFSLARPNWRQRSGLS
jgi:hypothetical protein